ncbi:hypothetical protein [Brachyspira pilosicoli]|uniref:hypothetical protein n=1 Tax=Brachyspira pilosicoli TaxID=52584 RepID=UPI0030054E8F
MQKQIKFLLTLLTVLILAISCANPSDPNNDSNNNNNNNNNNNGITIDTTNWKDKANYQWLQKTWETSATSASSKVLQYTDNKNNDTGALNSYHTYPSMTGMNYNMVIESITWISDTEGIMYGQLKYIPDYSLLGKYNAVAFKSLTENSVEFSDTSSANLAATLEEAQTTFTIETFTTYNSYTVKTVQ